MSSVVHMNGGQALAEMFHLHNPAPMFGMGGFQLLPFYDAVRELGLSHTLINDERCGIFAADAWARVTGRPEYAMLRSVLGRRIWLRDWSSLLMRVFRSLLLWAIAIASIPGKI